ncbi:MAG: hypothetical protein ACFE8E_05520 [Candidatus Hodarchaeota archaeon]
MRKKIKVLIIALVAILGGGALSFFIAGFATSGTISNSFTFNYRNIPLSVEDLNLNVDLGSLDIKYNTSNTPYIVKIDVDLTISGLFMTDRQYTDFFKSATEWWQNTTSPLIFDMELLPAVWFNPAFWFKSYNIKVSVVLRTDVVFDISAIAGTGSIEMTIPDDISLKNITISSGTGSAFLNASNNVEIDGTVDINAGTGSIGLISSGANITGGLVADTGTGSISINLANSNLEEDISLRAGTGSVTFLVRKAACSGGLTASSGTGSVTVNFTNSVMGQSINLDTGTGSINFKTYDMIYLDDSVWMMSTGTGGIDIEITQHMGMNANITGTLTTGTGKISILYKDGSADVGASFFGSTGTGNFIRVNSGGFASITNNPWDSLDFTSANNKYDISASTGTGNIEVDGLSV